MSAEENKALIRRYYEDALNRENLALLDELCAPGCLHRVGWWLQPLSLEDYKRLAVELYRVFPGTRFVVEQMVAEGDLVVARWTYHATHAGEYMGFPGTGKQVETSGVNILRIADGKIQDSWELWDRLGLHQQLSGPIGGQ